MAIKFLNQVDLTVTSSLLKTDANGVIVAAVAGTDYLSTLPAHTHTIANVTGLQTALDLKAPLDSPALTGTPTAPTAATSTNTTQIATTAYVKAQGYLTSVTNISGYAGTLLPEDNRTISPSELTAGRLKFGFTSWTNNNAAPYADFLHLRSYTDASGGNDNIVMFRKDAIGMRIWQQAWGSATAYSSFKDVAFTDSSITGNAATATILATARTITIGATGKSFNGSANVAWTLAEIGAQAVLTNPVTGTGTTNYIPKFTSASAIGNSQIFDNGTNVGIGTTSPGAPLHVYKSDTYSAIVSRADWNSSVPTKLALGKQYGVLAFISTDLVETTTDTSYIALNYKSGLTTFAEGLRVYNNGNVGIGTTSPSALLTIDSGEPRFRMNRGGNNEIIINHDGTTGVFRTESNTPLAIGTNGSERMRITAAGNVGIGTTVPATTLDVNGVITATGGTSTNWNTAFGWGNHAGLYLGLNSKAADSELLDGQDSTGFLRLLSTGTEANIDTYTDNGVRSINYTGFSKHLLSWNASGSAGTIQQEFDYSVASRGWRIRNKTDNTTWTSWGYVVMTVANQGHINGTLLHSNNFTTYAAAAAHTHTIANVTGLQTALDAKAPLASPALTGTPTTPTAAAGTNTTQIATTAFVQTAVSNLVDAAPATLDTLNELAAALGDDPNFATTITTALGAKAPLASPALTGTPTAPTAATVTNTTQIATTAFVKAQGYLTSIPTPVNGDWWNGGFVSVGTDGVMEMGKYMDFHTADSGGNTDFDLRVTVSPNLFAVGGVVSATGGTSTDWNTAYGWSNHAEVGYWLLTETGPIQVDSNDVTFVGNVIVQGTFTESSSIKFKENITPLEPSLEKVNQLEPVNYNKVGVEVKEIGLIAEQVATLFPEVVTYNNDGEPEGIQYQRLSVILLKAVQELTERVNKLENK
jgi:hypothetical protein